MVPGRCGDVALSAGRRAQPPDRTFRLVVMQDQRRAGGLVGALLANLGADRLAWLLVESIHSHADELAMAGRAAESLVLRRYASVITHAAVELAATRGKEPAGNSTGAAAWRACGSDSED